MIRPEWRIIEILAKEITIEGRDSRLRECGTQLRTLREDGLIKSEEREFGFKMKFYSLTQKGWDLYFEAEEAGE
jgi:hypothetical protein